MDEDDLLLLAAAGREGGEEEGGGQEENDQGISDTDQGVEGENQKGKAQETYADDGDEDEDGGGATTKKKTRKRAAPKTAATGRAAKKKKKKAQTELIDDDLDNDEDDEDEDEDEDGGGAGKKKADANDDDDDDVYGYDGYYKDEDDKAELLAMPELEREQILAHRAELRDKKRRMKMIKETLDAGTRAKRAAARKGRGQAGVGSKQKAALQSIKKKKKKAEKKKRRSSKARAGSDDDDGADDDDDASDTDDEEATEDEDEDGDFRADDEDEEEEGEIGAFRDDDFDRVDFGGSGHTYAYDDPLATRAERSARAARYRGPVFIDENPAPAKSIVEITLTRDVLAKWQSEPFFDESVIGAYIRIVEGGKEGGTYALAKILEVTEHHQEYELIVPVLPSDRSGEDAKSEKRFSKKRFRCWVPATNSETKCTIADASSKRCQLMEAEIVVASELRPTKSEVRAVQKKLKSANDFRYTAVHAREMVKKRFASGDVVASIETLSKAQNNLVKAQLERQKIDEQAKITGVDPDINDVEEADMNVEIAKRVVADIQKRYNEKQEKQLKNEAEIALDRINRRNREKNMMNDSALARRQQQTTEKKKDTLDPFSRRPTRPQALGASAGSSSMADAEDATRAEAAQEARGGPEADDGRDPGESSGAAQPTHPTTLDEMLAPIEAARERLRNIPIDPDRVRYLLGTMHNPPPPPTWEEIDVKKLIRRPNAPDPLIGITHTYSLEEYHVMMRKAREQRDKMREAEKRT